MKQPDSNDISQRLDGFEQRLTRWIDESRGRVNDLFEELRIGTSGAPATPREAAALEELSQLAHDASGMTDQVAVLTRLVSAAGALADRAVLFVVRDGVLTGWNAAG